MGFCLQLKLLVWKNFILKKRRPVILLLEILIPLLLFVVMVMVRAWQPPQLTPTKITHPLPLPSAGLLTILLDFCNDDHHGQFADEIGYQNTRVERIHHLLENLNSIGEKYDIRSIGQCLDALEKFSKNFKQIFEDLLVLHDNIKMLFHAPLNELFTNQNVITNLLSSSLSIPTEAVNQIMNSSLDTLKVTELFIQVVQKLIADMLLAVMQNSRVGVLNTNVNWYEAFLNLVQNFTFPIRLSNIGSICLNAKKWDNFTGTSLGSLLHALCHLNANEAKDIFINLIDHFHYVKIFSKLKFYNMTALPMLKDIEDLIQGVKQVYKIFKLLNEITVLNKGLLLGSCSSDSYMYKKNSEESTFQTLRSWIAIQTYICGKNISNYDFDPDSLKNTSNGISSFLKSFEEKQSRLKALFQSVNKNMRILYAPNNTDADHVIRKANVTFKMLDDASQIAQKFVSIIEAIRIHELEKLSQKNIDTGLKIFKNIFLSLIPHSEINNYSFIRKLQVNKSALMLHLGEIEEIACHIILLTSKLPLNIFMGFSTEADVLSYFSERAYFDNKTILSGVIFSMNEDGSLPKHLTYSIRQNATAVPSTLYLKPQIWVPAAELQTQLYYRAGFIWIQDLIDRAVISIHSDRDVIEPATYVQDFPKPCFISYNFSRTLQFAFPLSIIMAWIYTVSILVHYIVSEKENRLKEVMKTMGMTELHHALSWFVTSSIQLTITTILLTIIMKEGHVLPFSNYVLLFLVFESVVMANIAISFLISSMFSKAKLAAACTGIIYFMVYVPFTYVSINEDLNENRALAHWKKFVVCLFSTSSFGLVAKEMAYHERSGRGLQWDNWDRSVIESDEFGVRTIMCIILLDTLIYFVLSWYIQNVHPGTYGLPRPWYFPFTKSYWLGQSSKHTSFQCTKQPSGPNMKDSTNDLIDGDFYSKQNISLYFEPEPIHLRLGISIKNLFKVYPGDKIAVNGLSLNFYEGQITSFLGHNGAGKTTTLSILTGITPPTSGTAVINGLDIRTDMEAIRKNLGVCPQHNVLFDKLTVEEHLWLYCRLKGMSSEDTNHEIERVIGDIDLSNKRDQEVECLAGGMKRKLSIAIAFIGGSQIIILDEPTAGIDPYSRRAIWNLILKYKKDRTILLTTHHMDEAEILSDRIAVIANGQLQCCGSALFLKSHLGMGYHLHLVKQENLKCDDIESADSGMDVESSQIMPKPISASFYSNCCEKLVTDFIQQSVPTAHLTSETLYELHYVIPLDELRKGNFEKLFRTLDEAMPRLQIQSYGVKSTTLEEVFLKVTSDQSFVSAGTSEEVQGRATSNQYSRLIEIDDVTDSKESEFAELHSMKTVKAGLGNKPSVKHVKKQVYEKLPLHDSLDIEFYPSSQHDSAAISHTECCALWQMQLWAILNKRFLCTKRNIKGIVSQVILPAFFISVAMTVALMTPKVAELPPLELSPLMFTNNASFSTMQFVPFANYYQDEAKNRSTMDASSKELEATFHLASGLGGRFTIKTNVATAAASRLNTVSQLNGLSEDYHEPSNKTEFSYEGAFKKRNIATHRYHPFCHCAPKFSGFICSKEYEKPPRFYATSREILLNITGDNVMDYLLSTDDIYRKERFGALTLGLSRNFTPAIFGGRLPTFVRRIAVSNAAKVWYDRNTYHSLPSFLNVLNNAILRANVPSYKGDPATFGITTINHPLEGTGVSKEQEKIAHGTDFIISLFIITAMSFVPASFVLFLVTERYTKSKHLQMLSGTKPFIYWIGNYFWDFCNSIIPSMVCIVILLIYDVPAYTSKENFPAVVALFLLYGWSITPVMYPVSFVFQEPSIAYVFLIIANLLVGTSTLFTDSVLKIAAMNDESLKEISNFAGNIFLIFPNFCLGKSLMDLSEVNVINIFVEKSGRYQDTKSPWDWDRIPIKLVSMTLSGVVFFLFTLLCEWFSSHKTRMNIFNERPAPQNEDSDVASERKRVLQGGAQEDILRLHNLTKIYATRKLGDHLAVDQLTVGIRPGECFGLLGVNGAGKTTTFKMLTGDIFSTYGDAFINGFSINDDLHHVQSLIGYCPQFDALHDELTARDHLTIYSCFRGIPFSEQEKVVNWAIQKLDLVPYADCVVGTYSGGNRRKLATALALLGNPIVIYMDEPSTGMDPHSRRFLWDTILNIVRNGQSIVMSSHSMEECETLCSRLAIMVAGRFCCLGSVQHLKNKFGGGYLISVRVKDEKFSPVLDFFKETFPGSTIKEQHHNMLHFQLQPNNASLAYMFSCMEAALQHLPVEDYSVCQNTLDNVFINFVKFNGESMKQPTSMTALPLSDDVSVF